MQLATVGAYHRLNHGKPQAGTRGVGDEERLTEACQRLRFSPRAVVTGAQTQAAAAGIEMYLQPRRATTRLNGILDQVEHGTDQGVAVAQQLTQTGIALPTHL